MKQIEYDVAEFILLNKDDILHDMKEELIKLKDRKKFYKGIHEDQYKIDYKNRIVFQIKLHVLENMNISTEEYYCIIKSKEIEKILEDLYESENSLC